MSSKLTVLSVALASLAIAGGLLLQPIAASAATPSCTTFSRPLSFGSTDNGNNSDVSALQTFLSAEGYFNVPVIGIFGPVTLRAVETFQGANGIPAIGLVGPLTRARIQQISCGTNPPPQSNVSIYSITPQSGPTGTTVDITGFGFSSTNVIHFGGGAIGNVPIKSSIAIACTTNPVCHGGINQTLEFTVPSAIGPYCAPGTACPMYMQLLTPGTYSVYVQSDNGTSNTVQFTVTGGGTLGENFTATPTSGTSPLSVQFSSTGPSGSNIGSAVNFGDGTSGALIMAPTCSSCNESGSVSHIYEAPGTYTATLTESNCVCPAGGICNCPNQPILGTVTITVNGSGSGTLSISGLDAPSSLALGQSGTWTVHATGSGQLHYSVVWGDEAAAPLMQTSGSASVSTSATFTHAYNQAGTYTPTFTITDDSGHSATVNATVTITPLY